MLPREDRFSCVTCGKSYSKAALLKRHQLYECGEARKRLICDDCGRKFSRPDNLRAHRSLACAYQGSPFGRKKVSDDSNYLF